MKFRLKRKSAKLGIGTKTTFSHIALAVMVIIFVSISMFVAVYSFMRDEKKQSLLRQAKAIAQAESERAGAGYDLDLMKMYENLSDAKILYIDPDYVATHLKPMDDFQFYYGEDGLADDGRFQQVKIMDAIDKYFIARILAGESVADIRAFKFVKGDIIFAGAPIMGADGVATGGIVLIQSADVFRERSAVMLFMLLIVSAISITLAIAVSWFLSGRLTNPIVEITNGAKRLAEGKYGQFIEVRSADEIGELAGTLNTLSVRLRDVVGRLREERDKLNLIIDGIGEGIIAIDRSMRVVHCNESFLRLLEIGREPMRVFPSEEYGRILSLCMRSRRRERATWTAYGERRLAAVASPHEADDLVIGAVCLVQDVSEAERLEQMRRDYVANVSHELRTPLTGIRGMVEPLLDGYIDTEEEKQDCYRVIYQETIRLEKLIREMLDMSRLQDGRLTIEIEELEADGIIEAAVRRVAQTAAEAGIALSTEMPEERIACLGNEDRILQVLTVFLDNALSFTPSGGAVTVYARDAGARAVLGVRDTGCGIEPKDLPHIWERFYKVDKSRMRTAGTGLGLAIAKLIVELMGGEIGVATEPGKGTDFWFSLKKKASDD
jgi:signal transduction histidine kinase